MKDQLGNPVPSGIRVIDNKYAELGNIQTNASGYFELTIPGSERIAVSVNPHVSSSQHYVEMGGGFRISKYFQLTKTIIPTSDNVEIDFVLPPAAALWIEAYSPDGTRVHMGEFSSQVSPWYGPIYGAFPMESFGLPIPTEPSVGQLNAAWHPEKAYSQWEPYFAIPPSETVYLMMLWPIPNIGTIPLRADNKGQGYYLNEGEALPLNIVFEFAETEYRRSKEKKTSYEAQGYQFSTDVEDWIGQAGEYLNEARGQTDGKNRALLSYKVLELSIKAREQMAMEVADEGIDDRYNELTVKVQDETGSPIPGARVTYGQSSHDFVLGYGSGLTTGGFNPTYKAGLDVGFEYLYDMGALSWKKVSPEKGVYDFSEYDSALNRAKALGYEAVVQVVWVGEGNSVPTWAETLDFLEYKQYFYEYVEKAVGYLKGRVKYVNLAVEPSLSAITGSRYVNVELESSYIKGVAVDELIELVQTAFQAARAVDSEICFGYSVVPSYHSFQLNPPALGGHPSPYSLLKMVLEKGVRPDYIGVEAQYGTIEVPIDLSTLTEIIRAYHDLSGLPILITEMSSYPSRTEDYGLTGPAPNVYWHEGMTQKVQAEWDTSVFKIAMGLPYVHGVQLVHLVPDNPEWGQSISDGILNGTDYITQDYKPKQVFYAMRDLFDSWTAQGSAVTETSGKASFRGLDGDYSITVTTPDGLSQTFETHLSSMSRQVTLTVDKTKALEDLQRLFEEAQNGVNFFEQVGRNLDYNDLHVRLEEARSAIADSDYATARITTEQILDAVAIKIDGNLDDWAGIQPIVTTPPGGVAVNASGINLKALFGMMDEKYLYIVVEVYDPPISLQPGGTVGGVENPQFGFDLKTGNNEKYWLGVHLPYTGQMDLARPEPLVYFATLYTMAFSQVLEFKVPLSLLDNPTAVYVSAFVVAAENGQVKVAKAFGDYFKVLHPSQITNLAPVLDTVPPNDTFDGVVLDVKKWRSDTAGDGVVKQNGNIITSTDNRQAYSSARIESNWEFSGDFDVSVDFEIGDGWDRPAHDHLDGATFGVIIAGQSYHITRLRTSDSDTLFAWSTTGVLGDAPSNALAGKYRMVRIGTTLTFLYSIGTGWQELASTSVPSRPAKIYMGVGSINASHTFTTYFDNFHINSGLTTYQP